MYLGQLFDPLDNFDFCITTFFLNRQTKHTKSFIPPQSKKKKFILRKSVAQELLIEKIDHYKN